MPMRCLLALIFTAGLLAACSQPARLADRTENPSADAQRHDGILRLVDVVRKDPSKKPLLARLLMSGNVFVVPNPHSQSLALLFFDQPERSFIPVFSDRKTFDEEAFGTGFEGKAIAIGATRFASSLHGDEIVILNAGHRPAIEFRASELKAAVIP